MADSLSSRRDFHSRFAATTFSVTFATFLCSREGLKISYDGAKLLWSYGINNVKELVLFSQLSIPRMLIGFPLPELENIQASDFIKIILYGEYIKAQTRILTKDFMILFPQNTTLIEFPAFDPMEFRLYRRARRDAVSTKFLQIFESEYAWRSDMMVANPSRAVVHPNLPTHDCSEDHNAPIATPSLHTTTNEWMTPCDDPMARPNRLDPAVDISKSSQRLSCPSPALTMMLPACRGVTPPTSRGVLQVLHVSTRHSPREGTNSDSYAGRRARSDSERSPTTHTANGRRTETRMTDVPCKDLLPANAIPADTPHASPHTPMTTSTTGKLMDMSTSFQASKGPTISAPPIASISTKGATDGNMFLASEGSHRPMTDGIEARADQDDSQLNYFESKGDKLHFTHFELRGDELHDMHPDCTETGEDPPFFDALEHHDELVATGVGSLIFFDMPDNPEINKALCQSLGNGMQGETESIFPLTALNDHMGEQTWREATRHYIRYLWSLCSLDFLKMRHVKFKPLKHF